MRVSSQRALRQIAIVALWGVVLFGLAMPNNAQDRIEARVSKIIDGDTFTLSGTSRRIRIWGLDAPERDEWGGSSATSTLRSLIAGKTITCAVRDMDRYGRIVGQCFLPDGRDIAAEMIRSGVASEYCKYSRGNYGMC